MHAIITVCSSEENCEMDDAFYIELFFDKANGPVCANITVFENEDVENSHSSFTYLIEGYDEGPCQLTLFSRIGDENIPLLNRKKITRNEAMDLIEGFCKWKQKAKEIIV